MFGSLILLVFLAVLGIWKSVPVGFLLDVNPYLVCLMTILGGSGGVIAVYFIGTRIRIFLTKWMSNKNISKRETRVSGFVERYGIPGLGLFSTLVMGPGLTMALGLAVVKNHSKLLAWVLTGVVVWSVVLTFIGQLGRSIL